LRAERYGLDSVQGKHKRVTNVRRSQRGGKKEEEVRETEREKEREKKLLETLYRWIERISMDRTQKNNQKNATSLA